MFYFTLTAVIFFISFFFCVCVCFLFVLLFRSSKSFHVALIDFPKFPKDEKNFPKKKKKKWSRRSILIIHQLEWIPTCTFSFFLHITPHQSEPNNAIFMTDVLITAHEEWTPADVKEFSDKRIKKKSHNRETVVTDEGDSTKKGVTSARLFLGESQRFMNVNICVLFAKR